MENEKEERGKKEEGKTRVSLHPLHFTQYSSTCGVFVGPKEIERNASNIKARKKVARSLVEYILRATNFGDKHVPICYQTPAVQVQQVLQSNLPRSKPMIDTSSYDEQEGVGMRKNGRRLRDEVEWVNRHWRGSKSIR